MRLGLILAMLMTLPAAAQDVEGEPEPPLVRDIEEMLRDLFSEIEPTLQRLRDMIGSFDEYEAPEMLPNGDIIIRRRTPLEPPPETPEEPEVGGDEPIEL